MSVFPDIFTEMAVLLLFVVGLKLDLHIIRTMGPVALATGLGQIIFTSVIGYCIALMMGMPPIAAMYRDRVAGSYAIN